MAATLTSDTYFSVESRRNCVQKSIIWRVILFFAEYSLFVFRLVTSTLRWVSRGRNPQYSAKGFQTPAPSFYYLVECLFGFGVLMAFGYLRDILTATGLRDEYKYGQNTEKKRPGFVPLFNSFSNFYKRSVYRPVSDIFSHPIASKAGTQIKLLERYSDDFCRTFKYTGKTFDAINMGSYNYLDLNQTEGPIADSVAQTIKTYGVGVSTTRSELGMGFATNTTIIPALIGPGSLVISDEYNHSSIILGCRLSGATIKVFKHNDMNDLEKQLRENIVKGQPKTHRIWKKIMIMTEGVYSMEGSIIKLPEIIRLKKKYKAYLFLDEAHSIGATGKRGRGVTDLLGCDPKDIDVMMGTFTKSFGATGGYIGGTKEVVARLRTCSHGSVYGCSMSPVVAQQISSSLKVIMGIEGGTDGRRRLEQLARNTRYFREKLIQAGFTVIGRDDSPVVPMMVYHPAKLRFMAKELKEAGVATAAVGFPATSLTETRIRFCLSAGHTKEMLDKVLMSVVRVGTACRIRFSIQ